MKSRTLFFIVRRLCLSKRNKGIVHIISLISLIGVAIGSLALLVVLSVFNGFTSVAQQMLEKENPPILIETTQGKTFNQNRVLKLLKTSSIQKNNLAIVPIVEQTAMVSVGDKQKIVKLIGTTDEYFKYNHLDTMFVNGKETFFGLKEDVCIMGIGLAVDLGLQKGAERMGIRVQITVPELDNEDATVVEDMLRSENVMFLGAFQAHSALDNEYIFVNIDKARELLNYKAEDVTALYDIPKQNIDKDKYIIARKESLKGLQNISAKNLLEQQPLYFRIVKSEKLAVYVILSFIIFIATINILSSLIILYIQKRRMNYIFRAIGTTKRDLRKIYFYYGITINVVGCLLGVVVGLLFCLLQQEFGLIKLSEENFVVNAFPIKILFWDIIRILLIVLIIGGVTIKIITNRLKIK
ncbi:MAG: FtsX-like permease family protein [Bacteroidales bacterium]|nr:FtsX-like permease family protein [Bacteroidales bacterium]